MLYLIAYDIAHPRRLQRVAKICEDFGIRIQFSLFECWLEEGEFQRLWSRLADEMCDEDDRIFSVKLDQRGTSSRQTLGRTMRLTDDVQIVLV